MSWSRTLGFDGNGHWPALGAGLSGGGLPVGSAAPGFSLDGADGERHSLASLLSGARRLLVIFSDAGCGPCDALMPEIAGWQRDHREHLDIAVVTSGDEDRNRSKAAEHGLERVLLQPKRKVSDAYQAHATPMAVVIGADAHIASPTVGGADAIRTLVAQASAPVLAIRHRTSSNGDGNQDAAPAPEPSRIGEAAPHLELTEVDGQRVALEDVYEQRTLAIFWNPECGFCQQMLADLRALEEHIPESAPQIVVMSAGDAGQVRELGLRSRVLLDPDAEAMSAFGAGGTPMGVLIEQGRIASPVAAGAGAVFRLFHTAVAQAPEQEHEHPQGES
jgi:peroxiredoxin